RGTVVTMKDMKGMEYLAHLAANPNQSFHVVDLVATVELAPPDAAPQMPGDEMSVSRLGDAGPVLDAKAKAAYRARLTALRAEPEEASGFADQGRVERVEAEINALAEELARAVGLGGRDRVAASATERARINVQRRLRDAIRRIEAHDGTLGRYLDAAVKTGT